MRAARARVHGGKGGGALRGEEAVGGVAALPVLVYDCVAEVAFAAALLRSVAHGLCVAWLPVRRH